MGAQLFLRFDGRTFETGINNGARLDASGLREIPRVQEPARKDFERLVRRMLIDPILNTSALRQLWDSDEYCELYSVVGARWLSGSREILLSVLVRNTFEWRYMSLFEVYRVDATTGGFPQRYTAAEGHKIFGGRYLLRITR